MSHKQHFFDLAVIGGGPGGYPAAIKAAQNGKNVALIEAGQLGGTCLNRGCIPSKALIAGAEMLHNIKNAEEFGIHVENLSFDFRKMVNRKDKVVDKVRNGLEGLIAANNISLFKGYGKFITPRRIKITGEDNCEITAEKTIIATGSEPKEMPAFPFDHKQIHDSTSMLEIETLPNHLVIVGGGVIGCEFASLYVEFGVEVTILEVLPRIIPMECSSVSNALAKAFKKRGINIRTNVFVESIDKKEKGVCVKLAGGESIDADMALVATGRKLNIQKIGLENAGVVVNDQGLIQVNDRMETSVPGIYAVGDIASRWWLAHVASHQGVVAASNALGQPMKMHYNAVPSVIFTHPEIGTVGYTLEDAINQGYRATLGAFPFQALGKSQAAFHTDGFAQIVIDKETGQVLGAQVVGHEASTLVAEMGIVIANEMTVDEITHTIHAHPTIAEVWLEAAYVANEEPLHLPPAKKRMART
ncbi:Dihydrolipoyl dehydrogenase [Waddlia chondrophila 2032/99]|uniref:Dihydrolipoyl dehydrogenase n=1 Tax=Waddlia chondrophila 2032/99 TaxID=765953 RepID=F8LBC7_9BACT|nr:Dihydrolipoyl dehydrogenase [Waddlia chondrophila 2032/99]